jgi:hypothetical protein
MPLLVIETEGWTEGGLYRVTASLTTDTGPPPAPVTVGIEFALSPSDGEEVRWYLEDYLEFSEDPAPRIAERVERRMEKLGEALFRSIFHISGAACDLWVAARPRLTDTRVEVRSGIAEAMAIPVHCIAVIWSVNAHSVASGSFGSEIISQAFPALSICMRIVRLSLPVQFPANEEK